MKCQNCNINCTELFDVNNKSVCDLCLMDELNIKDPTDNRPKVTKCPTVYADGYGHMQPLFASVGNTNKKPTLDEIDKFLNNFIPEVL